MPTVKRFRRLGEVRPRVPEKVQKEKEVKRSVKVNTGKKRKYRSDRKHRYPLRIDVSVWKKVKELSLNCGGVETGASYNVILNMLILYALNDETIVDRILAEFPESDEIIRIRSWRMN